MKAKKIPRSIRWFFILMGLFMGQIAGIACLVIATNVTGLHTFAIWELAVSFTLYSIWMILTLKFKRELAEWGIIEIDKHNIEELKQNGKAN